MTGDMMTNPLTDLRLKQLNLEADYGKIIASDDVRLLVEEVRRLRRASGLSPALDVKEFHEKFGLLVSIQPRHLTQRKLKERIECLTEELHEFTIACGLEDWGADGRQDLAGQADALVDLVYFALGTAVMLGLPWRDLWDDVQRANMAKVRGVSHRGHAVDCVKPLGWEPPKTEAILAAAGYVPEVGNRPENYLDDPLLPSYRPFEGTITNKEEP